MNLKAKPGEWLLLILSLPSRHATPRMRVWRALKTMGAAVLRDGVYLLPENPVTHKAVDRLVDEVVESDGSAYRMHIEAPPEQDQQFRILFDRSADYAHVMQRLTKLRTSRSRKQLSIVSSLKRLRREYNSIYATDYFPGAAVQQAGQRLVEMESRMLAADEPLAESGRITRLQLKDYRSRVWATRARPWVDRLASAWLIRRFIDPKARILWLKNARRCPRHAIGFDFNGATFSHVGTRVTFEVLIASFGLDDDPALERLGQLVHYLDVGGVPVVEAAGLEAILRGAQAQYAGDNRLLTEASKTFDFLYRHYAHQ